MNANAPAMLDDELEKMQIGAAMRERPFSSVTVC